MGIRRGIAMMAGLTVLLVGAVTSGADGGDARTAPHRPAHGIFAHRVLVAYYGTAHTSSLGVLGEAPPKRIVKRLRAAARPYAGDGKRVQIVFELIASVADSVPGPDGDYSHLIPTSDIRQYVRAARRYSALLVLDLQPGRSTPPEHPLWSTPQTLITPHVGGASSAMLPRSYALVSEQLRRLAAGEPLLHIVGDG